MENILDHLQIQIKSDRKKRGKRLLFSILQISLFLLILLSPIGKRLIESSTIILSSERIVFQFLAIVVILFFSLIFIGFGLSLLWYILGEDQINIRASGLTIERSCIINFSKSIQFEEIEEINYFHFNGNSMNKFIQKFPYFFGQMTIMTNKNIVYSFGFDLSNNDFQRIKEKYKAYKKNPIN